MEYKSNKNDRLPPQNMEAEDVILCSMLIGGGFGADAINDVVEQLVPDDFYKNSNKIIFSIISKLYDKGNPVDLITVGEALKKNNLTEKIGGIANLIRLTETIPTASNVKNYAKIIKNNSILRNIIKVSINISNLCFEPGQDAKEAINYAEKAVFGLSNINGKEPTSHIVNTLKTTIKTLEEHSNRNSPFLGVRTGYKEIDDLTLGLQKSDLIILAARPAMGKTALALNIARNVARMDNKTVLIFSLEMSKEQLVMRLLCSEARISSSKVRQGYLEKNDWDKLIDASEELEELPIYIDDSSDMTAVSIRTTARRFKKDKNLELIIIDYLQLLKGSTTFDRRDLEIGEISRSLKMLAKELDVPVMALSQLNRKLEDRGDKRPQLADLRESGALEQDADVVMFIYRDEVYNVDPNNPDKGTAEILLSKQRNGPTGKARLTFLSSYTRFENFTSGQ